MKLNFKELSLILNSLFIVFVSIFIFFIFQDLKSNFKQYFENDLKEDIFYLSLNISKNINFNTLNSFLVFADTTVLSKKYIKNISILQNKKVILSTNRNLLSKELNQKYIDIKNFYLIDLTKDDLISKKVYFFDKLEKKYLTLILELNSKYIKEYIYKHLYNQLLYFFILSLIIIIVTNLTIKYLLHQKIEDLKKFIYKLKDNEYISEKVDKLKIEEIEDLKKAFIDNFSELKETKERFQLAIDGSNDGLWDWNVVTDEVYFSPRWKNMLGFKDSELENKLTTWSDRVHPDDLKNVLKIVDDSFKEQKLYESIYRIKCKDNKYKWILDRGKFIFDADAKPLRGVGFYTDITYIKELENELKELNKNLEKRVERELANRINIEFKYKYLFNNIDLGIAIYRFDENNKPMKFMEVNQKMVDMFEYSKNEFLNLNMYDLYNKEKSNNNIDRTLFSKNTNFEDVLISKSFKELNVEINSNVFIYNDELTAFSIIKDITEKKKFEKDKEDRNKLLIQQSKMAVMGEMIGAIAHQWKQPLNALSLIMQNAKMKYKRGILNDEEMERVSQKAKTQIEFMSHTIDDFRNFFKPSKEKSEFSIKEAIIKIVDMLNPQLKTHNIEVKFEEVDNNDIVEGYKSEFEQVILNILNNSKDAIEEAREANKLDYMDIEIIKIDIKKIDNFLIVNFIDNAGGVKSEVIDKIFDPYISTKGEKGTGIGLYMSKTIIDNMGGSIEIKNLKGGACFTIKLPCIN